MGITSSKPISVALKSQALGTLVSHYHTRALFFSDGDPSIDSTHTVCQWFSKWGPGTHGAPLRDKGGR